MGLSNKSSFCCWHSYTFPKTEATASPSLVVSFIPPSPLMSGGLGVQAEAWRCCAPGVHTITSTGATSSGQEGPGLAVGSWAPSLCLPQSLAMGTKGLTRVQPLELPVVKAWLLDGARAELSCIPAVSLPRLVDLDWRVDIKTSSDSISRMAVPTCLLQMKVCPPSCSLEGRGRACRICVPQTSGNASLQNHGISVCVFSRSVVSDSLHPFGQ